MGPTWEFVSKPNILPLRSKWENSLQSGANQVNTTSMKLCIDLTTYKKRQTESRQAIRFVNNLKTADSSAVFLCRLLIVLFLGPVDTL